MAHVAQQQRHTDLQPGDRVVWHFGIGQAKGTIVEKLTENKKIGSRVFKASPDDPKFVVQSETSGKIAVRKPEALRKIDEDERGEGVRGADAGGHPEEMITNGRGASLGVKEKRDERSDEEEEEEVEEEEEPKKMPDTGKGTVRATLAAKKTEADPDAGGDDQEDVLAGDDEELAPEDEEDTTYDPKEDEGAAEEDEEDIDKMPLDEDLLAVEELVGKGGEDSHVKDGPSAASKKIDLESKSGAAVQPEGG